MTARQTEQNRRYLEFSCEKLEFSVNPGEMVEGNFEIHTSDKQVTGVIYSTDTRMKSSVNQFAGENCLVSFIFDASYLEIGGNVKGKFVIVSNAGEYTIPFLVTVKRPVIYSSLGEIKDLFQFTNLAKTNWQEAVSVFYCTDFIHLFDRKDKDYLSLYTGLSRMYGNESNVEEFLIMINKKLPVIYETDIDGYQAEDLLNSVQKSFFVTRSGWGYTSLFVTTEGEFLTVEKEQISQEDFIEDACELLFYIDATKLHTGMNTGCIHIYNSCVKKDIPVSILIQSKDKTNELDTRYIQKTILKSVDSYVEMKMGKVSKEYWIAQTKEEIQKVLDKEEDYLPVLLFSVQLLLEQERFNEAKWYLDQIGNRLRKEEAEPVMKCYYYYLTTLFNRDDDYLHNVKDTLYLIWNRNPAEWRIAILIMYMEEEYSKNPEEKWRFLEEQYKLGCTSPVLLCEAVELLREHPSFLLRLDGFEQHVLWFAAKYQVMTQQMLEHAVYLSSRVTEYTTLLYRIFSYIYEQVQTTEALASMCRILIIGNKKGKDFFAWYELGVQKDLRMPKLYEYYMYSIDRQTQQEIPKIILMYFVYQSNLDYERNAYLYAYVLQHADQYPELAYQYRANIERFVLDQMKAGNMNEQLAYLYQHVLVPQMLRDEMAYAFTPLLFMHRIWVENTNMKTVVVIHNKVKGESSYPIIDGLCMIPIYGEEYQIFLQDQEGNRFAKSVPYENQCMMDYKKMVPYIGSYMEGRLSFDIYQCEAERNYITINAENVERYKKMVESEQVIDTFKQEIRTKLLHFYYESDRIGELDTYLEEIEADHMEEKERAEFIKFMISRGMFDKAYRWIKKYGMAYMDPKNVARLISKRIFSQQFLEDEFLVNVAFYIFKNNRYDENILNYLILHFCGTTRDMRDIWKAARDLELKTTNLMERILRQMLMTGVVVTEKVEIIQAYEQEEEVDDNLLETYFQQIATNFFLRDSVVPDSFFASLYARYRRTGNLAQIQMLSLLKYWAQNQNEKVKIPKETIVGFTEELLQKNIYFSFFTKLADVVPKLQYLKHQSFIEYHSKAGQTVKIHYHFDTDSTRKSLSEQKEETVIYRVEQMQEMAEGIFVKAFHLFHGEVLQYYITDLVEGQEELLKSDIIVGEAEEKQGDDRFGKLNDIIVSASLQDDVTADILLEEYIEQDFCTRELFRVM